MTATILHAVILQVAVNQELKGCSLFELGINLDPAVLLTNLLSEPVDDVKTDASCLLHDHLFLTIVAKELLEVCQGLCRHPDPSILYRYRYALMPIFFLILSSHPYVPRIGEFGCITDQVSQYLLEFTGSRTDYLRDVVSNM